jgi:hypothetical protein
MKFEDKVFIGGLVALGVFLIMYYLDVLDNDSVLIVAGIWFLWLCFHNRLTKTLAISALIGLLGSVAFGVPLGLLLFVVSMVAFWYAWI